MASYKKLIEGQSDEEEDFKIEVDPQPIQTEAKHSLSFGKKINIIIGITLLIAGVICVLLHFTTFATKKPIHSAKYQQILQLSKKLGLYNEDFGGNVCYEEGCLDTALHLLTSLDMSADPCQDFYQFSCGNWLKQNPPQEINLPWSEFEKLENRTNEIIYNFLLEPEAFLDSHNLASAKKEFKTCVKNYGSFYGKQAKKNCLSDTNDSYGYAIGKKFVEVIGFDEKAKEKVTKLVEGIRKAIGDLIKEADWMSREGIEKVLEKLESIKLHVGYPESWSKSMFDSITPTGWAMSLISANSAYDDLSVSITIPVGLLQPIFYDPDYPKHQIYSRIGETIAHELGHAFDSSGVQYNAFGIMDFELQNILEDLGYHKKTKCLETEFNNFYSKIAKQYLNGRKTLDENIADNIGARASYKAYQKYVEENGKEGRLPGLEGFTADQLYFLGYGYGHCESVTALRLQDEIKMDTHSVAKWRVIGTLRNLDEFAKAFNCKVDEDGMNPPEERKCKLW